MSSRFLKALTLIALVVATGAASAARQAGGQDPEALLREINQWVADQQRQAREKNQPLDLRGLTQGRAKRARQAVEGVDPKAVEPAKGLAWAQIFEMAEMPKEMVGAAERYLSGKPDAAGTYAAQLVLLRGYATQQDAAAVQRLVNAVQPPAGTAAVGFAVTVAGRYASLVGDRLGPQAGLDLLDRVEKHVNLEQLPAGRERQQGESAIARIADTRADLLEKQGKNAEALAALEAAKNRLPADSRFVGALGARLKQARLPGAPAPDIKKERGYGTFTSLADLRGKVVVLDFTAHW